MHEDTDPVETQEWLESLDSVLKHQGEERTAFLLQQLLDRANCTVVRMPQAITTPYRNTIPTIRE